MRFNNPFHGIIRLCIKHWRYSQLHRRLRRRRTDPGDSNGATTYALTFMMMMQYASCGGDADKQEALVEDVWPNSHNYGVKQIRNAVNTYNKAMQLSASDIPDRFECAYVNTGSGNQNFVMWQMMPKTEGKLGLKKASANTGMTGYY